MELSTISELITSMGFPIACVIAMGWFIFKFYSDYTKETKETMEAIQARCKEREDKLYEEIKANREVNAKAIETIAHYAEKLDVIQSDIKEIKNDITMIIAKEN